MWCHHGGAIDSPCECEHTNPDSLDARLFPSVVLAAAPAVTIDEASSLLGGSVAFTVTRGRYIRGGLIIYWEANRAREVGGTATR